MGQLCYWNSLRHTDIQEFSALKEIVRSRGNASIVHDRLTYICWASSSDLDIPIILDVQSQNHTAPLSLLDKSVSTCILCNKIPIDTIWRLQEATQVIPGHRLQGLDYQGLEHHIIGRIGLVVGGCLSTIQQR